MINDKEVLKVIKEWIKIDKEFRCLISNHW